MFSRAEKQKIAAAVEKVLLEIDHPEMPKEKPDFRLHVDGKEQWLYADIQPNWVYEANGARANPNPWNEHARELLTERRTHDAHSAGTLHTDGSPNHWDLNS